MKTCESEQLPGTELLQTLFSTDELSVIRSTFRRMEIAEDEIARAKEAFPLKAEAIHNAFRYLCPTKPLECLSDDVYRQHCRELLKRIVDGADLRLGTAAEVLALLSAASLEAPPTRTAAVLYWQLFKRVLPEQSSTIADDIGPLLEDSYHEQQACELEAKLRRKLTCDRKPS